MKGVVKTIGFLCIFCLVFAMADATLRFKHADGAAIMRDYYELPPNSLDVIYFGSSHMFAGLNTVESWQGYGVPAYNLCASMQPAAGSYYYMVEALKTQKPKVLVLDTYMLCYSQDYSTAVAIKSTSGMRFSQNKIEAVQALVHEDDRMDVLLGFPMYHMRYKELGKNDFQWLLGEKPLSLHGYLASYHSEPSAPPPAAAFESTAPLNPESAAALERMVALAKEADIPLVLVSVPYQTESDDYTQLAGLERTAADYGCAFVNYNRLAGEAGIDYGTDFSDPTHLNYYGATKLTRHLTQWLAETYRLDDRRDDAAYTSYSRWAQAAQGQLLAALAAA
jgi:hypothetical protein